MITFNELLERAKSEKIAVHTPTEEQAITLLKALDEKGYTWNSGDKLTTMTNYEDEKENTCYVFSRDCYESILDKQVMYDSLEFHKEHGYTIIEFSDIDFAEKTVKKAELKTDTLIVIKEEDLYKYLNSEQKGSLAGILSTIVYGRQKDGKKLNDYYVVNTDEPYAKKVLDLILEEEAKKGKVV